ncbi:MAG TPA: hypothetical protein VHL80_19380 [Polyangia bacterium]|nr:hypothetical protein [Polyangia bacterium]
MSPPPLPRLALDPLMIEGAAFYDVVGRPDLAAAYRARHAWAVASRVAGGISLGLGVLVWTTAQAVNVTFQAPFCATSSDPSCIKGTGTLWVPDVMMVGGLALLVLPALWSNDPVSFEEKERLASEAMSRGVSWNVSAAPAPGGQGGTIVLGGRF